MMPTCPFCETAHPADIQWRCGALLAGDVPCLDGEGHSWVTSDENENVSYCQKCGHPEY